VAEGLIVTGVVADGPAAMAGLRPGDVITSIDGQPAVSTDQLVYVTLRKSAGDRVELGYRRDGSQATATITLGASP
jgi:putative serine protease PepD